MKLVLDQFENQLLDDAWEQMTEDQTRLSEFVKLRNTRLSNEDWFEWELYYRLLRNDRGWLKDKRNRREKNRQRGDGVDLQFSNGKFIELRVKTTEETSMDHVLDGLTEHRDADACLFLALNYENLKNWLEKHKITEGKIIYRKQYFEIKMKDINDDWIVGIVKEI